MVDSVSNNSCKGFCKWLIRIEYLHSMVMVICHPAYIKYFLGILKRDLRGQRKGKSFIKGLLKLY